MTSSDEFRKFVRASGGVFTRVGALAHGMSERQFRTGSANGEWVRYRGVWILTTTNPSPRTVTRAALLRAGPDARLTGNSALFEYGLDLGVGPVTISVPESTSRRISGAVLLRDRDRLEKTHSVNGMLVMSRSRSIVDALRLAPANIGLSILDEVLRRGWTTATELEQWCERLRTHRGLPALRARVADAQSGTLAESERHLKRLMERAGLRGWVFNAEIRSATDELLGVGDCVHFTLKIVVEVDGWAWHTDRQRFQRDRDRQNALVHAGWMVLRFTWLDLTDHPDRLIASISRAITQANSTSVQARRQIVDDIDQNSPT